MIAIEQLEEFFAKEFPHANFSIEKIGHKKATIRKAIGNEHLRPGGTVSGPVLMALADAALYVAILSELGLVALAVTTNLNINFLRKPSADKDIIAECEIIKLGKSLVVGNVSIYSEGEEEPVAQAVGTYAIPPKQTNDS